MGSKGIVASTAAMARAAAGRHRRHDPRLAHARARRRPHARSDRRAGDPADAWACARSRRWSPPARAAAAPPAPSSRSWPSKIQAYLRAQMPVWRARYPGRRGDARRGDGLRGQRPGRIEASPTSASACRAPGEKPVAPVFVDGEKTVTLKGERIAEEFQAIVEDYVRTTLRAGARRRRAARRLPPRPRTIADQGVA